MARKFDTTKNYRRGDSFYFDPSDMVIDAKNNGRHTLPNIDWLIESIRAHGQTVPCVIRQDGAKPVMTEGHSRWRAIVEINKTLKPENRLKVWCVNFIGNEVDALAAGYISNKGRNALTPVDDGYFVKRMLAYGKTYDEIADICQEDVPWCKERLALVNLVPDAQKAVAAGEITPSAAKALTKLSSDVQRKALAERDDDGQITTASIRKAAGLPEKPKMATFKETRESLRMLIDSIDTYAKELRDAGRIGELHDGLIDALDSSRRVLEGKS